MFNKLKHIYQNSHFQLPLLIAFLLPFGINYAILIIAWLLCFFMFGDAKNNIVNVFKNKWSLLIVSFFLLHVFAYFFSNNKIDAITNIEIKLSFIAFPIIIYGSEFKELELKKIITTFITGCIFACFICLFRASYLKIFYNQDAFLYSEFSFFMHPSYFAMYLVFAQCCVLLFYNKWLSHLKFLTVKNTFISFIFFMCIFLCSSKMGLISAILIVPCVFIVQLFKAGYFKYIVISFVSFIICVLILFTFLPQPFNRLKIAFNVSTSSQTIDKSATESTAVRILIWKECITIIKNNSLFGVTPGDVHDKLCAAYKQNGLTGALKKELNAHNQYLQTFMGCGIIGFLILCSITLGTIIFGIIKKNTVLIIFSILMILNFMVESMLQAQAGFIFFVFFFCLFTKINLSKLNISQLSNTSLLT